MGDLTPRLGLICGMAVEARALPRDPRIAVAITGARPERAAAAAAALIAAGCDRLVSFGVAGGLDPDLAPGTLVLPGSVVWPGGGCALATPWPGAGGICAGSDTMVLTAQEKSRLRAQTGGLCVDMETHRVAEVAAAAGVPVAAIRVVGDPAGRDLPDLVRGALGPDGHPRIGPVLRGLLRRPGQLPGLLRLRADTNLALARLAQAAGLLPLWLEA